MFVSGIQDQEFIAAFCVCAFMYSVRLAIHAIDAMLKSTRERLRLIARTSQSSSRHNAVH